MDSCGGAGGAENPQLLPVSTETGALCWVGCANTIKLENEIVWDTWRKKGLKKIDSDSPWSRRIKPSITLFIRLLGNSKVTATDLGQLFELGLGFTEKAEECKQMFVMIGDETDFIDAETLKGLKSVGYTFFGLHSFIPPFSVEYAKFAAKKNQHRLSQFHDYESLIDGKDWESYTNVHPDRQWPADLDAAKKASTKLGGKTLQLEETHELDWRN